MHLTINHQLFGMKTINIMIVFTIILLLGFVTSLYFLVEKSNQNNEQNYLTNDFVKTSFSSSDHNHSSHHSNIFFIIESEKTDTDDEVSHDLLIFSNIIFQKIEKEQITQELISFQTFFHRDLFLIFHSWKILLS